MLGQRLMSRVYCIIEKPRQNLSPVISGDIDVGLPVRS